MSSLFRPEVLEAKRDTWLGRVQDIQPIPVRIISIASLIFTLIVILYFCYGGYTRRVHATGNMMPVSGLVTVGSRASGVITEKNVKEGQYVKAGEHLYTISLDSDSVDGPTQERINALLKQQEGILAHQIEIKKNDAPIEKQSIEIRLKNLQKQYQKVTTQINKDDEVIPIIQNLLGRIERAKNMSLATNQEYLNQLYTYAQFLGTHSQTLQNQTSIEGQILENASKMRLFDNKLQHDLNDLQKQVVQIKQQIVESEKNRIIYVTAPTDGTVTAVRGYIGQQVEPNSPLLSIVPKDDRLEAELYVPSSSIGLLQKNQPVILRYAAFPYQKFGLYKGIVTEITYSPITSNTMGREATSEQLKNEFANKNNSHIDQTLYRIRVRPDKDYINARNKKYFLQPGMRVEADIAVDYHRLYQWMFRPAIKIQDTIKTRLTKQTP